VAQAFYLVGIEKVSVPADYCNMNFQSIEWGDVPTWFAAIGTVATFIIYYFLLRGEIAKREVEEKERDNFTVRRVSAWIDGETLNIQNKGHDPVYYLVVYFGPMGVKFRPDSGKHVEMVVGTLGPDQQQEVNISEYILKTGIFPDIPKVELEFTDCKGRHWIRESNGLLREVDHRRSFD
jgi:hypothetical protein